MRPKVAISIDSPKLPTEERSSASGPLSSSRRNPEILEKPTMTSTLPDVVWRSPRRITGRNSGSTCAASLVSRLSCSARRRCALRQRIVANLLLERDHVLHQHGVQRPRVEKEHAAFQRLRSAATQAGAVTQVDVETRHRRRLEVQPQRGAPLGQLIGHPLHMARGEVACIHQLEQQNTQIFLLDRRQHAIGKRADGYAFDLRRARALEQRVQLRPPRRYPLLVPIKPDLGVDPLVRDLAREQFGQQRLPLVVLCVVGDLARRMPGNTAEIPASYRTTPATADFRRDSSDSRDPGTA